MNQTDTLTLIMLAICGLSGLGLLISPSWRMLIVLLAVQYLAAFWLINQQWPVSLAAVKLIAGWMAATMLSTSHPEAQETDFPAGMGPGIWFRLFAGFLITALVLSISPAVAGVLPTPWTHITAGLLIIGLGLLQLGMTSRTLRVIIGLLSVLIGFDVIYSALETSVLLAGLGAMVTMGLALVGSYLLAAPAGAQR